MTPPLPKPPYTHAQILAYGKACATHEREECARMCDKQVINIRKIIGGGSISESAQEGARICAQVIRERGAQ